MTATIRFGGRMRFTPAAVLFVLALAVWSGTLHAQRVAINSIGPTTTELSAAAQFRLAPLVPLDRRALAADIHYARAGRRDGEILMIVGGAVILTGLLADEGLITIAGAAIGGYGLYLYLRSSPKQR
jgi:hypothetical protein